MADIKEMYKNFGISEDVYDYSVKITDALKQRFQEIIRENDRKIILT